MPKRIDLANTWLLCYAAIFVQQLVCLILNTKLQNKLLGKVLLISEVASFLGAIALTHYFDRNSVFFSGLLAITYFVLIAVGYGIFLLASVPFCLTKDTK